MPQIQMLEPNPGFGSQLGAALGSGVGHGVSQYFEQKQKQQQLQDLLSWLGIQQASFVPQISNSAPTQERKTSSSQNQLQLTPEKVLVASVINPQLSSALSTLYQTQQNQSFKREEAEKQRGEKALASFVEAQTALPSRKMNLKIAKQAIQEGTGPFSGANLAEITGRKEFNTASGASLNTAMKNYLVDTLSSVTGGGARPNMYIEQQISKGFAQPGQKTSANLASVAIADGNLRMEEEFLNVLDKISQQYEQELGYVPSKAIKEAQREMIPAAEKIQDQTAYQIRELQEKDMSKSDLMKKVSGSPPLTVKMAKLLSKKYGDRAEEIAKKLGYKIVGPEIYLYGTE